MKRSPELNLTDIENVVSGDVGSMDADDLVGIKLGDRYELVELLGQGAMGWIYRGLHTGLGSSVAVKLMKPRLRSDKSAVQRFILEARASSKLNHPNIVATFDFGETSRGLLYLVTEFVKGEVLSRLLQREGRMAPERAVDILLQVLRALEESHVQGVVHRDLKPDNIMVTRLVEGREFIKVLDFGIAKVLHEEGPGLTMDGQIFGTPDYMAPEQIRSQKITASVDIYSSGAVLFELLTAHPPYEGDTIFDIMKKHLYDPVPNLIHFGVDKFSAEVIQPVLQRAMAKEVAKRFESAAQFKKTLETIKERGLFEGPSAKTVERSHAHKKKTRLATARTAHAEELLVQDYDQEKALGIPEHKTVEVLPVSGNDIAPVSLDWIPRKKCQVAIESMLAGSGSGSGLMLIGEAGSGKTGLAEWASVRAKELGYEVVRVGAEQSLFSGPWRASRRAVEIVLEIGSDSIGCSRSELEEAVNRHPALAGELPGLLELFGFHGPLAEAEENVRKCESISALARVLLLVGSKSRFLIFDDAHEYDRLSQLALLRLAGLSRGSDGRILITSEIPLFPQRKGWDEIHLDLISSETVRAIMEQRIMSRGVFAIQDAGWTPMMLEQTLAAIRETGESTISPDFTVGRNVAEVIKKRLSLLPGSALSLLQAAAVFGKSATMEELAILSGGSNVGDVDHDATLLLRRGYLRRAAEKGKVRLSHRLIAEAVASGLDADKKRELHGRAFEILKDSAPPNVSAHHADKAGADEQALALYLEAARLADRSFDSNGSSKLYRKAAHIARWRLFMDEKDPVYVDLRVRFGRALLALEDLSAAEVMFKSVEADAGNYPRLASWVGMGLADIFMLQSRPKKAAKTLAAALGRIIPSGEQEILCETYLELGNLLLVQERQEAALKELQEGLDLVTMGKGMNSEEAPESLWKLLLRMADLARRKAEGQKGEERNNTLHKGLLWGGGAMAQAIRRNSALGRARAHKVLSDICALLGRTEQGIRHESEAMLALGEIGGRKGQAACLLDIARMGPGAPEVYRRAAYRLGSEVHWCEEI